MCNFEIKTFYDNEIWDLSFLIELGIENLILQLSPNRWRLISLLATPIFSMLNFIQRERRRII